MSRRLTIAVILLASACQTASPQGEKVRVTSNAEVVRGCRFLGNVKATSGWGGGMSGVGANNAEVALRDKTAKLGGNVVFVVSSGTHSSGEAYQCETPKP